jgi:hypothetical protein
MNRLQVSIVVILVVLSAVSFAINLYTMIHPRAVFQSGHTAVSFDDIAYGSGDTVKVAIDVKIGVRVAIVSVKLVSSIEGLGNVTLFSGGESYWESSIAYKPGDIDETRKDVNLFVPYVKTVADTIKAEVDVYYVYASPIGSGLFRNVWETDIVNIEVKIKK